MHMPSMKRFQTGAGASNRRSTQRDNESIVLYLSQAKGQPLPLLPFELQGHIHPDDWAARLPAIVSLAAKFYNPLLERIWVLLGVIGIIVIPAVIYPFLLRAFGINTDDTEDVDFNSSQFFKARAISFGIFVATFLFFFVPLIVWKLIGKRAMQAMLSTWARTDQNSKAIGSFIPVWNVSAPGIFSSQTVVRITLPAGAQQRPVSNFHPNAYLPPYLLNQPPHQGDYLPGYGTDFDAKHFDADAKHFEDVKV